MMSRGIGRGDIDHGVLNLSTVAAVLAIAPYGMASSSGGSRLVNYTDRFEAVTLGGDQSSATLEDLVMVPLNGPLESLELS